MAILRTKGDKQTDFFVWSQKQLLAVCLQQRICVEIEIKTYFKHFQLLVVFFLESLFVIQNHYFLHDKHYRKFSENWQGHGRLLYTCR